MGYLYLFSRARKEGKEEGKANCVGREALPQTKIYYYTTGCM